MDVEHDLHGLRHGGRITPIDVEADAPAVADDEEAALRPFRQAGPPQNSSSAPGEVAGRIAPVKEITELRRLASPAPRPQCLVFDGGTLWMGSIETSRIYEMDPVAWKVRGDWAAPGKPWGMTCIGRELRLVCGEGEDDDRFIRRFVPGTGFDPDFSIHCPGDTGSQLGWDGKTLHLNQWHRQRVLALAPDGTILRAYDVPHWICGQVIANGAIWVVATDVEESNDYLLTRIDPATGKTADLARIPFPARGLAFDGKSFWTNWREKHEIIRFAPPA